MSRKEKIIANRDTAQNNFEMALHNTAKSEAAVELYKACREGVTSLVSERAKAGMHLQEILNNYLPELEELTENIIEAQIVLMEDKQKLKETYEISMQADKVYFDMLEESGKGAAVSGN